MKNKIIILTFVTVILFGCYTEQHLKQILPLLDINIESSSPNPISTNSSLSIDIAVRNLDIADKIRYNYDILIGGKATKNSLGIIGNLGKQMGYCPFY